MLDCPIGNYIVLNEDATAEHQCIPCQQCAADEMPLMITAAAGYINIQDDERGLCIPGGSSCFTLSRLVSPGRI